MLTIRDHYTGLLFDPWAHLGEKRQDLLKRSWAGVFREFLLHHLPVQEIAPRLCEDFGRPSKDLHMVLGVLVLQQLHDLTDRETVEALALNIGWHYALDVRRETDAYLCERTLRAYRRIVIDAELDGVLFRTLTDRLIKGIGVNPEKQRLDSTSVRSFMRSLTRLGILVEGIGKFLRELERSLPELFERVDARYLGLYVEREGDGCFALTKPSESKRRLPEAASDLYNLLATFRLTEAADLESFRIIERIFEEQCQAIEQTGQIAVIVKEPKDVPCDNVMNPADPDASYSKHKGTGYLVQVMETYSDGEASGSGHSEVEGEEARINDEADKPDLITYVAVGKMNVHDGTALVPALEDTHRRGIGPKLLLADTHYGSNECVAKAADRSTELVAPSMTAKGKNQGKLTLEDFELGNDGRITRCPQGQTPTDVSLSKTRLQARFDAAVCSICPVSNVCPAGSGERLQYMHARLRQRARRLAEQHPGFRERYRWRAGVEATVSRLKYQMGLGALRVRGEGSVRYTVSLRALGLNIHRVAAYRRVSVAA